MPKSSWYNNLRKILNSSEWNRVRNIAYKDSDYHCSICGETGLDQAYTHPVECHETWSYSNIRGYSLSHVGIQKLESINALCPLCHLAKHMGFAESIGKQDVAIKQYSKVNKLNFREVDADMELAFTEWRERNKYKWKLDCARIEKEYGININHGKNNV